MLHTIYVILYTVYYILYTITALRWVPKPLLALIGIQNGAKVYEFACCLILRLVRLFYS